MNSPDSISSDELAKLREQNRVLRLELKKCKLLLEAVKDETYNNLNVRVVVRLQALEKMGI